MAKHIATASLVAVIGAAAHAAPTNILTLGDSITQGTDSIWGNTASHTGYRLPLQEILHANGFDYNFIGTQQNGHVLNDGSTPRTLSDGVTPFDPDNYGWPGHIAAASPNANPFIGSGAQNGNDGTSPRDLTSDLQANAVFGGEVADIVLLHIGTNPLLGEQRYGADTVAEAQAQLANLFDELETQWNAGNIASDARIIVANIIPKPINAGGVSTLDDETVVNTFNYNAGIDATIASISDASFRGLFERVDMFAIEATQDLADDLGVPLATLNTDDDIYVDWVNNINESDPQALPDGSAVIGINSDLLIEQIINPNTNESFIDKTHPETLGYQVMANVWADAILVPEPGSMSLLAVGGLLLMRRRRG